MKARECSEREWGKPRVEKLPFRFLPQRSRRKAQSSAVRKATRDSPNLSATKRRKRHKRFSATIVNQMKARECSAREWEKPRVEKLPFRFLP
jgi:hypothetical protein